jgi:hypothetical protein
MEVYQLCALNRFPSYYMLEIQTYNKVQTFDCRGSNTKAICAVGCGNKPCIDIRRSKVFCFVASRDYFYPILPTPNKLEKIQKYNVIYCPWG